jgi:hypothetical protein
MTRSITTMWAPEAGFRQALSARARYPMQRDRKDRIVLS